MDVCTGSPTDEIAALQLNVEISADFNAGSSRSESDARRKVGHFFGF